MDELVKFACGGIRRELAIVKLKHRSEKREQKLILSKIKKNQCVISYGVYCECKECLDYDLAVDTVGDADTKVMAMDRLTHVFSEEKSIKYCEIMDDLMGFPI